MNRIDRTTPSLSPPSSSLLHLVEDVVVALHGALRSDSTLLQQVVDNLAPLDAETRVQVHLCVFIGEGRDGQRELEGGRGDNG